MIGSEFIGAIKFNFDVKGNCMLNPVQENFYQFYFQLENNLDGNGDIITFWNVSGLAQPTADQIASYETAANTEEANNIVIATRKSLYGSWESQLEEINEQGIDSWKARIAKVKSDNPKPE